DWMAAAAEARAQARELDRRADEAALERAAVGVVVLDLAVVLEAEAGEGPAAGGESRGHHLAAAHALALAPQLLDQHAVAVTGLDLAGKVDVVLEDAVSQGRDRARGQAGLAGRAVQRVADLAGDHRGVHFDGALDHLLGDGIAS